MIVMGGESRKVMDDGPVDARSYARAILNILDDSAGEKTRLESTQRAILNILDDSAEEKTRLGDTQRAILNILDDFDVEKKKVEQVNVELRNEVAERKRAEEALQAANKELEAFSYSVSHDLRAPLRHVSGFVDLLQDHAAASLDEEGKRYLTVITNASKQMGTLIDDLLSFSRLGRAEMHLVEVNVNHLVTDVLQELTFQTKARNIQWNIAELQLVQADPMLLRAVITNLISNAVKYTGKQDEAIIEIGTVAGQDNETVFYVRDNGAGFDMKYVDKLFGVFQRLHSSKEFEGTGIGLATVRRIITRHGGRTWAEGTVGSGATFYFSLPTNQKGSL